MEIPETRYARTADGVSIAYQVVETLSTHDERAKVEIARHYGTRM